MIEAEPLRNFIRKEFLFDSNAELGDEQPLFPDIIDSLGVMELVDFVEEHYGVEIPEDDLLADNFESVSAITALVERHRG